MRFARGLLAGAQSADVDGRGRCRWWSRVAGWWLGRTSCRPAGRMDSTSLATGYRRVVVGRRRLDSGGRSAPARGRDGEAVKQVPSWQLVGVRLGGDEWIGLRPMRFAH